MMACYYWNRAIVAAIGTRTKRSLLQCSSPLQIQFTSFSQMRFGWLLFGSVQFGLVWFISVRFGTGRFSLVWLNFFWSGSNRKCRLFPTQFQLSNFVFRTSDLCFPIANVWASRSMSSHRRHFACLTILISLINAADFTICRCFLRASDGYHSDFIVFVRFVTLCLFTDSAASESNWIKSSGTWW